ncbi:hypothetical protein X777_06829 [Ooceraea biroi]|uniref:Uncharacterized protein n=1 Tax=Ooceraea biroi TaxID=2015173 RepID=A0A026WCC6_OOCBI|nr:hypothetical protein X777_06829 [Ooceraea biroi]
MHTVNSFVRCSWLNSQARLVYRLSRCRRTFKCTDTPAPSIRVPLGPYPIRCDGLPRSTCVYCPSNACVHRARVR